MLPEHPYRVNSLTRFLAAPSARGNTVERRARGAVIRFFLSVLVVGGLSGGCSHGELRNGIYSKSNVRYRVGPISDGWRQVWMRENDLAFMAKDSTHSMAINSTCEGHEDAPLAVLTQHLLMGFTDRTRVSQELRPMDGRESLQSHYQARLDGVPIELLLVVMKKDGCVYDLTYLAPKGRFDEKLDSFERLLQQFRTERAS